MPRCYDDSCDLVHCEVCRKHTAGNELITGKCFDCLQLQEDRGQPKPLKQHLNFGTPFNPSLN